LRLCRRVRRIALRDVPPAPLHVSGGRGRNGRRRRVGERGRSRARPHATGKNARKYPFRAFSAAHAGMRDGTRLAPAFLRQKPAHTRHSSLRPRRRFTPGTMRLSRTWTDGVLATPSARPHWFRSKQPPNESGRNRQKRHMLRMGSKRRRCRKS
jgi:hypothetical protein